jgi:hypothetical protein
MTRFGRTAQARKAQQLMACSNQASSSGGTSRSRKQLDGLLLLARIPDLEAADMGRGLQSTCGRFQDFVGAVR